MSRTLGWVWAIVVIALAVCLAIGGWTRLQQARTGIGTVVVAAAEYVGSETCRECHAEVYEKWAKSGHRYMLSKIEGDRPPRLPYSFVPTPPPGYAWSDVTYMLGGYGWKARWLDRQGYLVTGRAAQYNLATGEFVPYSAKTPSGTKPYDCGRCHTTGWADKSPERPHHESLPGVRGTFAEPGIGCEACHGPGDRHVKSKEPNDIAADDGSELCGRCHYRDVNHRIIAKSGFIKHHEQYDELIASPHKDLRCVDCHDPHRGVVYQKGIVQSCQQCHPEEAEVLHHPEGPTCIDCHMPEAAKSAVKWNDYKADIRSHLFRINTEPVGKDAMFYEESGKTYARDFVTLDFACYGCHRDPRGVGGHGSVKTLKELSEKAANIHEAHE